MSAERITIIGIRPSVDCGRYPAKACVGDEVEVSATVVRDGHEVLRAAIRATGPDGVMRESPMRPVGDDRFAGMLSADRIGRYTFRIVAWVDRHAGWLLEHDRKVDAGQEDLSGELSEGKALFGAGTVAEWREQAGALADGERHGAVASAERQLDVERLRAREGAWYELFPRSWGGLRGIAAVVPELAALGFDVIYLPPIHPIGRTNRKGANNSPTAQPGEPGSPWAIGATEGGHNAVHPELGTLADLEALVGVAAEHGLELALDLAIQMSPDHPWLAEHPQWFQHRPDGTLKYAENPPKRYQDIHNVDWDTTDRESLWEALRDVVLHWCKAGVRVYRVDNPHTKPLPFWEWLIAEVRALYPDAVFLSEAFTRPAMMTTLGKVGFSQSYTYFTWKNSKTELVELVEQLRSWRDYLRPNLWPNTPDILHAMLVGGGRAAFESRLVLAATLSPSYGIYSGYEACENVPLREGSEEYLDSEKYELKERRLEGPLLPLVGKLNEVRRARPALREGKGVRWLETLDDGLVAYALGAGPETVIVVVNIDPTVRRTGVCDVPGDLGLPASFTVRDELSGLNWRWAHGHNYVSLEPGRSHLLTIVPDS
ncbi:MAG: maltotransferase domain-containing protein [Gaiellales bacterium]